MIPEDRDRFLFRMMAAWPRTIPTETLVVWQDHLCSMDADTAAEALRILERTKTRPPSIADLHEAYTEARSHRPALQLTPSGCALCDEGWIWHDSNTVAPCPNGCKPPTSQERNQRASTEERQWRQQRHNKPVSAGVVAQSLYGSDEKF